MDNLLKSDFTAFNTLPYCNLNIRQDTSLGYFEIEDANRIIVITQNNGTAKYSNPNNKGVAIINYDGFLSSLPEKFQHGKERCDLIVYTIDNTHFYLNELKDSHPNNKVLSKAIKQMLATLIELKKVQVIFQFINGFASKKCCYCNKQPSSNSEIIKATLNAFNQLKFIAPDGLQLSHPQITALGFELFEYMGNQVMSLN